MFHRNEEALLCRGSVLHASDGRIYDTLCFKVMDITPVVGYDLDLVRDQGDTEESWSQARRYIESVKGNTPALCCDVMFGRKSFIPKKKANGTLSPCELVYEHKRSEAEARLLDTTHAPHFYRAACLDIDTVVD
ncbi:hypothetical protein Q5P01_010553 [Channa striata]|uniref:Uncharacterized protein n=1 Tax=Channa striata TaxID=64152 RepID=A0AA88SRW5_CHASR|nr:hypothetical protein Q5P01_010553 [Channa striata]